MSEYAIKPLGPDTWVAFADLAERHNGVWNGCWCTWFHPACRDKGQSAQGNRAFKERLVDEGRAHAALGGVVEAYPQDTPGKKVSASFLYNGTRSLFEQAGFSYERPKGLNHCVMSRTVPRREKPRV